jgi:long-chain fatty acid transport protein
MPRATYSQWPLTLEVPRIDAKTPTSHYLGFLGAYYRPIGEKVVVGLGIGTPSSQGIIWDGSDFADMPDGPVYDRSSKTGVFSFSPLVAVKLNEWLSVGVTLNINLGTFNLKMPGGSWLLGEGGESVDVGQYEEGMTGWGFGATFGVLAKPVDKLGIGLAVRTSSTISYNGTARLSYLSLYGLPDSSALERKITWPLWIAGGVSFRPIGRLLLSADVQWTQWSKLGHITTSYLDPIWQLNIPWSMDGRTGFGLPDLFWENSTQLRFGVEYTVSATTALRAGYYNDPAPGPYSTMNILLPTHTFNAFSIGIGKTIGGLQLDFGLEYLAGKTRSNDSGFVGNSYGMNIVVPSVSVQYKF